MPVVRSRCTENPNCTSWLLWALGILGESSKAWSILCLKSAVEGVRHCFSLNSAILCSANTAMTIHCLPSIPTFLRFWIFIFVYNIYSVINLFSCWIECLCQLMSKVIFFKSPQWKTPHQSLLLMLSLLRVLRKCVVIFRIPRKRKKSWSAC